MQGELELFVVEGFAGSRTTNYVGILSQGLRIAPPEAPVTGYMVRIVHLSILEISRQEVCVVSALFNICGSVC